MSINWETIQVDGSAMRTYVAVPEGKGPHPAVVVAQHAFGVDETMQDAVHRLYRAGYAVASPELYHRVAGTEGDAMEKMATLRDDQVVADMNAAIAHLKGKPGGVSKVGVTGFCMGGRVAYLIAVANSEIAASAVFYGGNIMKPWGTGPAPFERTADIKCPLIGFFGVEDTNPAPADVQKIDAELTRLGKWHEFHSYNNTGHAFHNFQNSERYRERAARSSWESLEAFFNQYLKSA